MDVDVVAFATEKALTKSKHCIYLLHKIDNEENTRNHAGYGRTKLSSSEQDNW